MSPLKSAKGFITMQICGYVCIGLGVAMLALGAYAKIQSSRLEAVKAEYASFQLQVKILGEEAERKTKAQEAKDKVKQEKANAELKKVRADNVDLSKRLHDARADIGFLSRPGSGAPSPERACFNYTELERTLQHLDAGVSRLIAEGAAAIDSLNVAKAWAQSLP